MPQSSPGLSGAIFLDRDGVLNRLVVDRRSGLPESPYSPEDMELMPGALDALRVLRTLGAPIFVVSNQPAAAKGTCSVADLAAVHEAFMACLAEGGETVDAVEYCLHHPEGIHPTLGRSCPCRKPQSGLLEASSQGWAMDRGASWLIGDSDVDIIAGQSFGARTVLVEEPLSAHRRPGDVTPDFRAPSVLSAARLVASNWRHHTRRIRERTF